MSKRLNDMKWESVALEGFSVSMSDKFQGFVGLEECTDYSLDKEGKHSKKNNLKEWKEKVKARKEKKRKRKADVAETDNNVPSKVVKLNNGFIGELCKTVVTSPLNEDDMLTWAEFKLQEPIMKALTELGFKQPTKIQQLTLPAAIHGRRDILGAAETGSGKTLAFGLPILSGILKLKEKAELKGLDVYEIPYKKGSIKKKVSEVKDDKSKKYNEKKLKYNEKKYRRVEQVKESSEDGYSTGLEGDEKENDNEQSLENSEDDYLEEIEVPFRKRDTSADEGNDSDDENYIHLSDLLESDDLDSSDDNGEDNNDKSTGSDGEQKEKEMVSDDSSEGNDVQSENSDIENEKNDTNSLEEDESPDEGDENEQGHVSVKCPLYALIMAPTRELAVQIAGHLKAAAKYTGIRVATIVGGMAAVKQERVLRSSPEIVVATPGRLWELIGQGQPHLQQLDTVKFLAIDETDHMIERGHFQELWPLLERMNADDEKRAARQNFLFSATITMVQHDLPSHIKGKKITKRDKITKLIKMIGITQPKVVDITMRNVGTAETLTEAGIVCALEHKDAYLYYILKRHPDRTIVFCNSIGSVRRLAQLLMLLKCRPLPLHANMPQRQRLKNLERFRDDPHGVLIATNVAARGLDIPHVEHVIHYQVPRTAENYVHRSGRTARATREGLTILMMEPTEAYLYAKLCRTLNKTTEIPTFPVDPQILSPLKDLVATARELDGLDLKKRRTAQAVGWRERAAKEMDIIIDDDVVPVTQIDTSIDKALKAKKRQFEILLSRPIYPKGFSFKYPTLNAPNALINTEENALQVMKKALESGQLKKDKRKSKNASLLQLQKKFKKK